MATPSSTGGPDADPTNSVEPPGPTIIDPSSPLHIRDFNCDPPRPPGALAQWIQFKFCVTWNSLREKPATLQTLCRKQLKQEPTLRRELTPTWPTSRIIEEVISSASHFEASVMQVVGTAKAPANKCREFLRGFGPFEHCVMVEGISGCGNCYWDGNGEVCSLNTDPTFHRPDHRGTSPARQHQETSVPANMSTLVRDLRLKIQSMNELIEAEKAAVEALNATVTEMMELIQQLEDMNRRL